MLVVGEVGDSMIVVLLKYLANVKWKIPVFAENKQFVGVMKSQHTTMK